MGACGGVKRASERERRRRRVGLRRWTGPGKMNWAGAGNWAVVGSELGRKGRLGCLRFSWFGF